MARDKTIGWGLAAMLAVLILDQASKSAAHPWLAIHGPVPLFPFLNLAAASNTGIAFGLGTGAGQPLLILVAATVITWLAVMLMKSDSSVEAVGLGAIIGGALGNAADRLRLGAVRDFIDFHLGGWHWPTFNLADTFIFVGVALLVVPGVASAMTRRSRVESRARPERRNR